MKEGNLDFTIFKDPKDQTQHLQAEISNKSDSSVDFGECWKETLYSLNLAEISWGLNLIIEFELKFPWRKNDPDIGLVKFINCVATRASFLSSVETMLHEATHLMKNDACLYGSIDESKNCFNLGPELPPRSLGKYTDVPPEIDAYYRPVQHLYMESADEAPILLFDELNAYTTNVVTETSYLQFLGHDAVFPTSGHRALVNLPLFMFYSVHYVDQLQKTHPDLFQKYFVDASDNSTALHMLLQKGHDALNVYKNQLRLMGEDFYPAEQYFFDRFEQERVQVGL